MIQWKIEVSNEPNGEVVISKPDYLDCSLAIDLGAGKHLTVYLTKKETIKIAKALRNCVVGVESKFK